MLSLLLATLLTQATMSPTSDLSTNRVRATGSTTARALRDRFADVVNVKDFGLACDGITNDSAALSALVASIGSATKTIQVTGNCVLNSDITIATNITVLFLGEGKFSGTGKPTFKGFGMGLASQNSILTLYGNNGWPAVGGQVLAKFVYGGGLWVYDWLSICPMGNYNEWCNPTGGAMTSIGSDLGAGGTTLSLMNNGSGHDFLKIRSNDGNSGFMTGGPYRLIFSGSGVMSFGDKVSSAPALKPLGAELAVRKGDDSGDAFLHAAGAAFAEYDMGVCSTTLTLDPNNGSAQKVALGGNCGIAISPPTTGTQSFTLKVTNNGTYTLALIGAQWAGGTDPVFTATTAAVDVVRCYHDGSLPFCDVFKDVRGGPPISPYNVTELVGTTQQFVSAPGVTWSVTGAGCGTIDASTGLYTAPAEYASGCAVVATNSKGSTSSPVTLTTVALSVPFDTPGCYASGTTVNGYSFVFSRASTRVCTGVGTCAADSLCVDSEGAQIDGQLWMSGLIPSGTDWMVVADYTPGSSRAWNAAGNYALWMLGTSPAQANSAYAIVSGGSLVANIFDSSADLRQASYATGGVGAGLHRIAVGSDLAIYVDGVSVGGAPSGAGSGVITTMPDRLVIGNTDGSAVFSGAVKNLKACKTKTLNSGGCL